jgi:hypothetical protein
MTDQGKDGYPAVVVNWQGELIETPIPFLRIL